MDSVYLFILTIAIIGFAIIKIATSKRKNNYKPKELTEEQQREYYYSCLYNSLVLFAATPQYLESLGSPVFNPLTELEAEFDYAFGDFVFEQNFKNNKVKESLRNDLIKFKEKVNNISSEIWTLEKIATESIWMDIRNNANEILNKMGEKRREYDFSFTTIIYADNK